MQDREYNRLHLIRANDRRVLESEMQEVEELLAVMKKGNYTLENMSKVVLLTQSMKEHAFEMMKVTNDIIERKEAKRNV